MDWQGKVVAITGGANGIGRAIATKANALGAKVAICDLDKRAADALGEAAGVHARRVDVTNERALAGWISTVERELGPVHAYFSNAGIGFSDGPGFGAASAPNEAWTTTWEVNVMASVYAARHLVPLMTARGGGVFVITASAAGFLNSIGDSAYSATKHAAVSFAESLAIAHGDEGLQVACLCPEGVTTALTKGLENSAMALSGFIEPEAVADTVFAAIDEKKFRVFTHGQTEEYVTTRITEPDRWLGGMRSVRRNIVAANGRPI